VWLDMSPFLKSFHHSTLIRIYMHSTKYLHIIYIILRHFRCILCKKYGVFL
jgi:hypothetical protein